VSTPATRTVAETAPTVTCENSASAPARPQRPIEETMKDILDAISELDGCELSSDVRGDLSWMARRARRIGK